MAYQNVFKRYELKYVLTPEQKVRILNVMGEYMVPDKYDRTVIRNLYFDTDNYRLIRRSIEKPAYKEKLRLRSYCQATAQTPVFVELKKKYRSVVYKRRLAMPEQAAQAWLLGGEEPETDSQIGREIRYFLDYYGTLAPRVFLSYRREAFVCQDGGDFRVTFDDNILCRQEALSLQEEAWGTPILEAGKVLMELKTGGAVPLWMTQLLSQERIYKTSFSKYGTAYQKLIFKGAFDHV